jgi:hypothetical protein
MNTARRPSPIEAGRLPNFIFARDAWAEGAYGYTLVGMLLTDIPCYREMSKRDRQKIREIIKRLNSEVRRNSDLSEVGIWRNGKKPPDAIEGPFSATVMRARAKGCMVLAVLNDDFSRLKNPDDAAGRPN